jgi:enoyl-CoA hydratase
MDRLVEPKKVDITYETENPILYEVTDGVAWIMMNRPDFNNAQNGQMTYALDDAFQRAVNDDAVKAIVLGGVGKHFSAGHDIGTPGRDLHHEFDKRLMIAPHTNKPAAELLYTREQEQYLGMCRRWRDVPKPTVAMVQGACIAGGLMLAWICDLIVASEDAFFQDPVVPLMGIPGVEYFAHAYVGWQAIVVRSLGFLPRLVVGLCANVLVNTFGLVCSDGLIPSKRITCAGSWFRGSDWKQCIA